MRALWTMVASDLRQRLLDGSLLTFGLLVPLGLMFAFNMVFSGMDETLEPVTVAVSAPADDQLAAVIPHALGQISGDGLEVTVREAAAEEVPGLVEAKDVGVGIVLPDGFGQDVMAGGSPEVHLTLAEAGGLETRVVASVVDGIVTKLGAGAQTMAAAQDLGADPQQLMALGEAISTGAPATTWSEGRTADEQLDMKAAVVAGQAGLFLLFTVGFGVLGLVIEREWGTLARLASMPMPSWLIVLAKGLVGLILGVGATAVLLLAGELLFGVDFGSWATITVLLVAVCTAATSLMFIIARVARTAEQSQIAQAIVAITLGMAGGAFFPMNLTGLAADLMLLNPVAALVRGLGITSGGGGVLQIGPLLGMMAAFTVVALLLARFLPGRKELV